MVFFNFSVQVICMMASFHYKYQNLYFPLLDNWLNFHFIKIHCDVKIQIIREIGNEYSHAQMMIS